MVILLFISRHSTENCPLYNEEMRKMMLEEKVMEKREKIMRKHGVKQIGGWMVPSEHLIIQVMEALSLEAYQKFELEFLPLYYKTTTTEMKVAYSMEEIMKMLQQAK